MKPKFFLFFLLLVSVLTIHYSQATIRYVSKTGTSTPPYTSWETAADSIQKCINACNEFDTVCVANGVYKENLIINTPISLIGSSMDSTVIDGTDLVDYTVYFKASGTIKNLTVNGRGENVFTSRIIYSDVLSNLLNVYDCRLKNAGVGIGMPGGDLITDNIIITGTTRGINLFGSILNEVSNCIIIVSKEGSSGIYIGFAGSVEYKINNNIILFTGDQFTNSDCGITAMQPHRISIYNNFISGFHQNIWLTYPELIDTARVINNVLVNQPGGWGSLYINGGKMIANNIIFNNNHTAIDMSSYATTVIANYNLFWKNLLNYSNVSPGNNDLIADPMFVKDSIPDSNFNFDYHLQAFSPAIDKGNPNILDKDGTRSDIGMYGGPFGETYTYQDLAPLAPRNLSAVLDSEYIRLKWNRNTEADTAFYKVYRDTVIGFVIDSIKLISSLTDTFFVQPNPQINIRYVYKITCVDNQGNESQPSTELVVNITGIEDYPQLTTNYLLYQNYPNPFNPNTKIGYQLKERAYVKLMVYDIKGELVSVLVNKEQNAGYYEVEFVGNGLQSVPNIQGLASGIYLYRIEVIGEGSIPIYSDMKKMVLIK